MRTAIVTDRTETRYKERLKKNNQKRCSNPELHDKERMKIYARKKRLEKYGITEQDYTALLKIQNYQCAICGSSFDLDSLQKTCHIDHNRATGIVSGLLCNSCNLGLGKFRDDKELLSKAGDYLQGKRALITGVTGQDGYYLAHFLIKKGYEVHGLIRRTSQPSPTLNLLPPELQLHEGDITDFASMFNIISEVRPHEIYNLAAQSQVGVSFKEPLHTTQTNYLGVINILECARLARQLQPRIYQASTSEMLGGQYGEVCCNEETPFYPRSPYGVAKLAAHHAATLYREAYGLFVCTGILFNHESPRRGTDFVTRKITMGVAAIKHGYQEKIRLGNLDARRDWGYAPEFVKGMWMMLNHDHPDNYILATGETHSIREFCQLAFTYAELGDYQDYIEIDPKFFRPAEVDVLIGDYSKAKKELGWEPQTKFSEIVIQMVDHDLSLLEQGK